MRVVTGIEHVLFWDALSQRFVVDRTAARSATTGDRAALDCSGDIGPLDEALARRVGHSARRGGWYLAATTGDLLINDSGQYGARALLVRRTDVTAFPPDVTCRDPNVCEIYSVWARGWSLSGAHFVLHELDDALQVYRTDDLAVVYRRAPDRGEGFLLIDDRAAYFVDRRGRFTRDAWR